MTRKKKDKDQKKDKIKCTICLDDINDINDKDVHTLSCEHKFHIKCIDQWMRSKLITLNNDPKRWGMLLIDPVKYGFSSTMVLGLYDTGAFTCPICKKNYSLIHPAPISKNIYFDKLAPISYSIKIKFVGESVPLSQFWYSQYVQNMSEFKIAYIPSVVVNDADLMLFDKLTKNTFSRNILTISKWYKELEGKNDPLVLHAVGCGCSVPTCLGYFFVKESECPLCNDSTLPLMNHFEHLSPKQLEKHLERWGKSLEAEKNKKLMSKDIDSETDEGTTDAEDSDDEEYETDEESYETDDDSDNYSEEEVEIELGTNSNIIELNDPSGMLQLVASQLLNGRGTINFSTIPAFSLPSTNDNTLQGNSGANDALIPLTSSRAVGNDSARGRGAGRGRGRGGRDRGRGSIQPNGRGRGRGRGQGRGRGRGRGRGTDR